MCTSGLSVSHPFPGVSCLRSASFLGPTVALLITMQPSSFTRSALLLPGLFATILAFFLFAGTCFLSTQVPLCPSLFGRSGQVLFANHAVASAVFWVQHVASGWVWCGPGSCAAVGVSSHTEVLRNFAAPLCWFSLPFPLQSLAPLIGGAARRAASTSGLCVQGFRPPA